MKARALWFLVILLTFAVLLASFQMERDAVPENTNRAKSATQQVLAGKCAEITKKQLHDPDSAQIPSATSGFDFPRKFAIGESANGVLSIQFEMRARNAFNAIRANVVTCTFSRTKDGGYTLLQHDIRQL